MSGDTLEDSVVTFGRSRFGQMYLNVEMDLRCDRAASNYRGCAIAFELGSTTGQRLSDRRISSRDRRAVAAGYEFVARVNVLLLVREGCVSAVDVNDPPRTILRELLIHDQVVK